MEYFLEFHWWYLLLVPFLFLLFGKRKGGVVVERFDAKFDVLDKRFETCRPEAMYAIFKQGTPDHFEIEIKNVPLETDEELEFHIDGKLLAKVRVEKDKEAEFDHWSDEGVDFPRIKGGEQLIVKYRDADILKAMFQ